MPYPPSTQAKMELEQRFNEVKYRPGSTLQCSFAVGVKQDGDAFIMFCVDEQGQAIKEFESVRFYSNITDVLVA